MPLSPGPGDSERLHGGCRRPQLARLCVCHPDGLGSHPTAALGPVWVPFPLLTPLRQRPITIFKSPKATRSRDWPPSVGTRMGGAGRRWDRVGTGQCEDELSTMTTARNCFGGWQAPRHWRNASRLGHHSALGMLQRKRNPWNAQNGERVGRVIFALPHTESL